MRWQLNPYKRAKTFSRFAHQIQNLNFCSILIKIVNRQRNLTQLISRNFSRVVVATVYACVEGEYIWKIDIAVMSLNKSLSLLSQVDRDVFLAR